LKAYTNVTRGDPMQYVIQTRHSQELLSCGWPCRVKKHSNACV